jgi:2',3'-cyclic-nucleotide 2'-phosphodiesterase (5'-nucleotidase family)
LPTEDYAGHTNLGGLARCATVIRQTREREKNVLLLDAGDTLQGTAASYLSDGQVMVRILNLLRYDAWCWGNHEFDWGLEKLALCAEDSKVPILNANVRLATTASETSAPAEKGSSQVGTQVPSNPTGGATVPAAAVQIASQIKPYIIRDVDGVKLGIIGLNTPGIPNWSRPRLIRGLKFLDSVETLKSIVPAVRRAGAQVIVLVCHQGYRDSGDDHANQINAIARSFPELDVIIGGHTHRNFPEYKVSNILYCQADYFGIHLGRVDLVFDTDAGRVVRRESKTLLMDEHVPLDKRIIEVCSEELGRAAKELGSVIGEAKGDFDALGAPKHETPIHNLIFESIAAALRERRVPVDAVVHGILDKRASLKKGPITVGDVWKVMPYENTIGVLRLTPDQLRQVLEEDAVAYDRPEFRGMGGLQWTLDPSAAVSNRVLSVTRADGSAFGPNERLAVAFNSYELASGGLRWNEVRKLADLPETGLVEYDVQTRQAVIEYVRKCGAITPAVKGWWKTERRAAGITPPR